jgi:hypothetical protein
MTAALQQALEALRGMLTVHDMTQSPAGDRIAAWSSAVNYARAAIPALEAAIRDAGWRDMTDTTWLDGKDVVLFAHEMEIHARYCPGEWTDHHEGREYNGSVWSAFDDALQFEIEETSPNPEQWHHGRVTRWRIPTPPEQST